LVSDHDRPEPPAIRQLEQLVKALGDELASFRRRAQVSEGRVRVLEAALADGADGASLERLRQLEKENEDLRARVGFPQCAPGGSSRA
jgi:hypothetical protein